MTLRSDFQAAGEEYAHRLDERAEAERLAALQLEARRTGNAAAFAEAVAATFAELDESHTTHEEN
jgi:hypothetical protein